MNLFSFVLFFSAAFTRQSFANPACAVCTVGVAVGLELARNLGVDDGVIAVWAGALLTLIGYWTILWCDKKGWNFRFRDPFLIILSLSMIAGVYIKDLTYTPKPVLVFYLDPFLFCTLLGGLVLIYSARFYQWMKAKNGGHAHFPFEKVVVPLAALALTGYIVNYLQLCVPDPASDDSPAVSLPADGSDIYDFGK